MTTLNIDLGEHDDEDSALYALADWANLATGAHAGTPASMVRSVERAHAAGATIGAHPSFPDRASFGRAPSPLTGEPLRLTLAEQLRQLGALCAIRYVKPHGSLYHAAGADPAVANALLDAIDAALGPVPVIGPTGLLSAVRARGWIGWTEGFADRGVAPDGTLIPRGRPGALLTEAADVAARARALIGRVDTVCVHGDTPGSVALARAVRDALGPR